MPHILIPDQMFLKFVVFCIVKQWSSLSCNVFVIFQAADVNQSYFVLAIAREHVCCAVTVRKSARYNSAGRGGSKQYRQTSSPFLCKIIDFLRKR